MKTNHPCCSTGWLPGAPTDPFASNFQPTARPSMLHPNKELNDAIPVIRWMPCHANARLIIVAVSVTLKISQPTTRGADPTRKTSLVAVGQTWERVVFYSNKEIGTFRRFTEHRTRTPRFAHVSQSTSLSKLQTSGSWQINRTPYFYHACSRRNIL